MGEGPGWGGWGGVTDASAVKAVYGTATSDSSSDGKIFLRSAADISGGAGEECSYEQLESSVSSYTTHQDQRPKFD